MKKEFIDRVLKERVVDTARYRYKLVETDCKAEIVKLPIDLIETTAAIDGWETVQTVWVGDADPSFAEVLEAIIWKSCKTQKEIAAALEIPLRTLENWVSGKSEPNKITRDTVTDKLIALYNL